MVPWSPLGAGILTGKYRRGSDADRNRPVAGTGDGRLSAANPLTNTRFDHRTWSIVETLVDLAQEIGASPAEVALAWLIGRPTVTAPILGVRTAGQLDAAFGALKLSLERPSIERLQLATSPTLTYPATLFGDAAPRVSRAKPRILNWQQQVFCP